MLAVGATGQGTVVKSAARVFEVFELLREEARPLTATAIGRRLSYPKSSTNALLKSLVAMGYLSFEPDGLTYFPTLRLTDLGHWLPAALLGSGDMLSMLEELRDATSETVTLSMHSDLSMQFLRVLPGTFPISLRVTEGYLAPLFGTGVGIAFLSTRSDADIEQFAERFRRARGRRRSSFDLDAVLDEVRTARQRGYVAAYDRLLADTGAIAMPMPTQVDGQTLVVAVAGLGDRIRRNEKTILRSMRRAMDLRRLSRRVA